MKFYGTLNMNLNDILICISNFLRAAPSPTIKYIIHSNFLFNLLLTIDNTFTKDFFIQLFDPVDTTLNLSKRNRKDLYLYCEKTQFFVEMSSFMLDPKEGFNKFKCSINYKPESIKKLTNLEKYFKKQPTMYFKRSKSISNKSIIGIHDID